MDDSDKDCHEENSHLNFGSKAEQSDREACDISVIRLHDMSASTDIMTNNGTAKYNSPNAGNVRNNDIVASGLLTYAPKCCQNALLSIYGLLFFLSWASTIQGAAVNGLINLGLSTLERRFNLKSVQSGFIAGSYDIGFMLATIPIAYFGGIAGASKPRYIALGLMFLGTGSFIFALPHFLSSMVSLTPGGEAQNNNGDISSADNTLCRSNRANISVTDLEKAVQYTTESLAYHRYWFIFGQILHGIGAAPILTLGITLLEEVTDPKSAPFYIAILQTFFVVGPALGYVIGGQFLDIYVDFDKVGYDGTPNNMQSSDPTWIGAWWLGFLLIWGLSWICAFFLFCYPAILPYKEIKNSPSSIKMTCENDTEQDEIVLSVLNTLDCESDCHSSGEPMHLQDRSTPETKQYHRLESGVSGNFKDAVNKILQLMKNPSYILLCIGGSLDSVMVIGLATFLPKFIMSQYGFTASFSAIIMGIIITPSGGLGTVTGGYLVKHFKMSREQILKMYIYSQCIAIPCLLAFLCYCSDPKFAGVNVQYQRDSTKLVTNTSSISTSYSLLSECNVDCAYCGGVDNYQPVCGENGYMYLNSCYAGCRNAVAVDQKSTNYSECSCVVNEATKVANISEGGLATTQMDTCNVDCRLYFYIFVLFLFLIIWFSMMSGMPCIACVMRFVEPENKSLSMGICFIIARLLGSIPGPVLFGFIIDQACVLSTTSGNCLIYDNFSMSIYMMIASLTSKCLGLLFISLTLISSRWCKIKEVK